VGDVTESPGVDVKPTTGPFEADPFEVGPARAADAR